MPDPIPLAGYLETSITTFMLVLMRIGGLAATAPVISSNSMPVQLRLYLVLALSLGIIAFVPAAEIDPQNLVDLALAMAGELLVGLILGSFLRFVFQSLQLAGQLMGQQMGLSLASVINPTFDEQSSTVAAVYVMTATLMYLAFGGDVLMMDALLQTFLYIPLGQVVLSPLTVDLVLSVTQEMMKFAVRVAAPTTISLLLIETAMGFVGRTVPQLNFMSVGFPLRLMMGIYITIASLNSFGLAFSGAFDEFLSYAFEGLVMLMGN